MMMEGIWREMWCGVITVHFYFTGIECEMYVDIDFFTKKKRKKKVGVLGDIWREWRNIEGKKVSLEMGYFTEVFFLQ